MAMQIQFKGFDEDSTFWLEANNFKFKVTSINEEIIFIEPPSNTDFDTWTNFVIELIEELQNIDTIFFRFNNKRVWIDKDTTLEKAREIYLAKLI